MTETKSKHIVVYIGGAAVPMRNGIGYVLCDANERPFKAFGCLSFVLPEAALWHAVMAAIESASQYGATSLELKGDDRVFHSGFDPQKLASGEATTISMILEMLRHCGIEKWSVHQIRREDNELAVDLAVVAAKHQLCVTATPSSEWPDPQD
jgi:hypothetical protein